MKKIYVLDTNVLLHDPKAFSHFDDNDVVIPLKVIEEIDHFKRDLTELGRNARQVSRMLDALRKQGKLADGVKLESGGLVRIAFPGDRDHYVNGLSADDQILKLATEIKKRSDQTPCIVVSKDINMRLKADALGLDAEDYETDHVDISELYTGQTEIEVEPGQLEAFKRNSQLPLPGCELSVNQYVMLRNQADSSHTMLARFDGDALVPLVGLPEELRQVQPRNREQHYALDALLNDHIKLVTIIGKAGTGKTLLAVAAGLHKTIDSRAYRKMLVCRPTVAMGKDIGYLPGTMEEKLNPWMQPIFDAMDLLSNGRSGGKRMMDGFDENGRVSIEPLTYIRGRSIANQFIILDEAQNLTPLEAKTVITRVGPGTKIVLTGDIYQIDNPYVDSMSNGLSTLVERFRPYRLAAHIMLSKGVRSEIAELAANLL
ncbi:MAG TPA: phosphate starvation-inducible protein PhoH [Verrucomicrobia bacterium]|nr:MAG: phosphate starvation-inducible protein PhoH [Lentisphaerae bacterium GWF2_57_35]HBA83063.1 phosphate starvation-inducible protein PhoH [Verrucomicrobiota bacterium]